MTPNTAGSRVLVRAAYVAQYPDPVAFRAGETVEVGDPELRAAVADVRDRLGGVAPNARELTRMLGR